VGRVQVGAPGDLHDDEAVAQHKAEPGTVDRAAGKEGAPGFREGIDARDRRRRRLLPEGVRRRRQERWQGQIIEGVERLFGLVRAGKVGLNEVDEQHRRSGWSPFEPDADRAAEGALDAVANVVEFIRQDLGGSEMPFDENRCFGGWLEERGR
jgi:hypothetical protein